MNGSIEPELDFYLLIPYYNNLTGLIRSLESISYPSSRYGLLIVDDGSLEPLRTTDLAPYLSPDLSLNILRLPVNGGITKALNEGLRWLEGRQGARFVARLDCGDICHGERFEKQIRYLDQHPDIDLVGSWCIFKDPSSGMAYRYKTPTEHARIMRSMYFRNIFIHPTVMWRSTVNQKAGVYPEQFPHAEDYGFFYEILSKGKAAVIPEDLVICEINPKGLSLRYRKQQLRSRGKVVRQYGKNGLLTAIGMIKLGILGVIPYGLLFRTKKLLYGI